MPVGCSALPAGFGQEGLGPLRVEGKGLHVVLVPPRPRLVGADRRAAQTQEDPLDDLLLVDGVGDGLPDALVLEARVPQVEPQIGVAVGEVPVPVKGLLEGRVVRLPPVLDRRQAGHVDVLRLQLQEDGGLVRDDPVHDPLAGTGGPRSSRDSPPGRSSPPSSTRGTDTDRCRWGIGSGGSCVGPPPPSRRAPGCAAAGSRSPTRGGPARTASRRSPGRCIGPRPRPAGPAGTAPRRPSASWGRSCSGT